MLSFLQWGAFACIAVAVASLIMVVVSIKQENNKTPDDQVRKHANVFSNTLFQVGCGLGLASITLFTVGYGIAKVRQSGDASSDRYSVDAYSYT
jgi:hypothetical protein